MVDFKTIFLEKFEEGIKSGKLKSVCDMGSGTSLSFLPLLEKYPNLVYVGIEPSRSHAEGATKLLKKFKNARIYHANGYSPVKHEYWGKFDLVLSLSVLEHVKQLERFLQNSASAARKGGLVVHRWDLGHALYPSSDKERLQVWLGNNMPAVLPEHKFVRDLRPSKVAGILPTCGLQVIDTTYHQMPSHKNFLKYFLQKDKESEKLIRELVEWEFSVSPLLGQIEESKRVRMFPAIAIWSKKK